MAAVVAPLRRGGRRGRSGLHRATVLARARRGRPRGPGNREQTADGRGDPAQARVKRCGKSAPSAGATRSDGNPRREQGRTEGRAARPLLARGTLRWAAQMDGHRTGVPQGPGEQNPAYRPTHRHHRSNPTDRPQGPSGQRAVVRCRRGRARSSRSRSGAPGTRRCRPPNPGHNPRAGTAGRGPRRPGGPRTPDGAGR